MRMPPAASAALVALAFDAAAPAATAAAQNLAVNGDFARDVTFWKVEESPYATIAWDPRDGIGSSASGSALLTNVHPGPSQGTGVAQCVGGLSGGVPYEYGGKVQVLAGQSRSGSGQVGLRWYSDAACTERIGDQPRAQTSQIGTFISLSDTATAPSGTRSAELLAFPSKVEAGGQLQVLFDDMYLRRQGSAPPEAARHAFRVRSYPTVSAAEGIVGDREPGPEGFFWFAVGLYDNPTGFYTPVVYCLEPQGILNTWTLDVPQSFFAAAVRRAPNGVVWTLVPRTDADASILYRLEPGSSSVARFSIPFRARWLELDPQGDVPWVGGAGKLARQSGASLVVYDIPGFTGGMSRFDASRRLWLSADSGRFLSFSAATGNLETYADAGDAMLSPDVDETGVVWAMRGAQDQVLRFDPIARTLTRFPLAGAAPNWVRLAAAGSDRVGLAAAYGPHVLSHLASRLTGGLSTQISAPTSSSPGASTAPSGPVGITAVRAAQAVPYDERVAYAEDDGGRGLFTAIGAGYAALVHARGGEMLTASPVQWWRPIAAGTAFTTRAALPVAVEVRPTDPTTNFFTELTITNVDAAPTVTLLYRTSAGEYAATLFLAAGETQTFDNVIAAFRELGAAIPAGSTAGTLTAVFANGSGRLAARVYTRFPDGSTTGLAYTSLDPSSEIYVTRKALNGLKSTSGYRTNVAAANLCPAEGTCPTLELTATFVDDATGQTAGTRTLSVPPREWRQLDAPLAGLGASGETFSVVFSATSSGPTGYDAYATVIDNGNQDAAFFRAAAIAGGTNLTLSVVTDAAGVGTRFTSECAITNTSGRDVVADVIFTSAQTGSSVSEVLALPSGRGIRYPNAVDHFRALGPGAVRADDFGPIRISFRDFATGFASQRTTAGNGTGLGFVALDRFLARAQRRKRVIGLAETSPLRTNLAVAHLGATTNDPAATIGIRVTIFDIKGEPVGQPLTTTLEPGRLFQWNRVLSTVGAFGSGYSAVVERTSGRDAFDAYITVIDNLSSDPSFNRAE